MFLSDPIYLNVFKSFFFFWVTTVIFVETKDFGVWFFKKEYKPVYIYLNLI